MNADHKHQQEQQLTFSFTTLTFIQTLSLTKLKGVGGLSAEDAVILLKSMVLRSSRGGVPEEVHRTTLVTTAHCFTVHCLQQLITWQQLIAWQQHIAW